MHMPFSVWQNSDPALTRRRDLEFNLPNQGPSAMRKNEEENVTAWKNGGGFLKEPD
jgi:hypothetical protein